MEKQLEELWKTANIHCMPMPMYGEYLDAEYEGSDITSKPENHVVLQMVTDYFSNTV